MGFVPSILPQFCIGILGAFIGRVLYFFHKKFRKRTLSNLSLATELNLTEKEIKQIAIQSFVNLVITIFEYPKIAHIRNLSKIATCKNPKIAQDLVNQNKGVIFFCAHQANWELLFLDGTTRMPGVAIGRPIKNEALYHWIKSIRERFGGKIIDPKNAIKEGMKALKKGMFLGIVGDQGMPSSFYESNFLGTNAYTSPIPAILSYRTNCPVIFASIERIKGRYEIEYSDPIWPNKDQSQESEVDRIMGQLLSMLAKTIKQRPSQWMWQHNRWKQETPANVYYRFRHDTLLVILPENESIGSGLLSTIEKIYPKAFIDVLFPKKYGKKPHDTFNCIPYEKESDLYLNSYRYKLVFNFTDVHLKGHYKKLSAFEVLTFDELKKIAKKLKHGTIFRNQEELLLKAIARKGTLWN